MFDFKSFSFSSGSHKSRKDGMCIMDVCAYVAGEPHSDHPKCACPVITAFLISWNDSLPSDAERNRLLAKFVFRLPGTRATPKIEMQRSFMALDWLVRVHAPAFLDLTESLKPHAQALRSLPRIKNVDSAISASEAVKAAWAAAWAAARAAAGAAAWAAAWDVLKPVVAKLQRSAQRLVNRMIRLTEISEPSAKKRKSAEALNTVS